MIGGMGSAVTPDLSKGGTIDGDLTIGSNSDLVVTGDFKVEGAGSFAFDEIIEGTQVIEKTSTEAFLVRKDSDGGDVFVVDTQDSRVEINGFLKFSNASYIQDIGNNYLKLRIASGDYFAIHGGASDTQYFKVANDGQINTSQLEVSGSNFKYMANGSNNNLFVNTSGATISGTLTTTQLVANGSNFKYMANGSNANLTVNTSGATVSGTITSTSTIKVDASSGNHGTLELESGSGNKWSIVSSVASNNLDFYHGTPGTVMTITKDTARVGIGTISPNALLSLGVDLTSTSTPSLIISDNPLYRGEFGYSEAASTQMWFNNSYDHADSVMQFRMAGSTKMTLTGAGNVKSGNAGGWYLYNGAPSSVVPAYAFADDTDTGIGQDGANNLTFISGGSKKLQLDSASRISLSNNDSGASNTIFGKSAGANLDAGSNYNTFIGEGVSDASMDDAQWNTGVGNYALSALTSGDANTALGNNALNDVTTGGNNVAVGSGSLDALTTGSFNVAMGESALTSEDTGTGSTAIGAYALQTQNGNGKNVSVGYQSTLRNATGEKNVLVGYEAGLGAVSGNWTKNVGVGHQALYSLVSGGDNVALGDSAGFSITTGGYNVALGSNALPLNTTANHNVSIGHSSMLNITTGDKNVAIGSYAMAMNNDGNARESKESVFIGYKSGGGDWANNQSHYNTAVGAYAMDSALNGALNNIAVGHSALSSLTTGDSNVAIGKDALYDNTSGVQNIAIGFESAKNITIGDNNIAIGREALATEDVGDRSIAIGTNSLFSQNSDTDNEDAENVAVGIATGYYNVTGQFNTYIGSLSGYGASGQSHSNNTAIGYKSLFAVTTGGYNNAIGVEALDALTTGGENQAMGVGALGGLTTQNSNIGIGGYCGTGITGSDAIDNILIGGYAGTGGSGNLKRSIAIGKSALNSTAGNDILGAVAIGFDALTALTSGANSTALGYQAGKAITTASNSTFIGYNAGQEHVTGDSNTAIGTNAMYDSNGVAGYHNTFLGVNSGAGGWTTSAPTYNVGIGNFTLDGAMNGANNNVALGYSALGAVTTGHSNVGLGSNALDAVTSGHSNVGIGRGAGGALTTGTSNVAIGSNALDELESGSNNVAIGKNSINQNTVVSNVVAIGHESMGGVDNANGIQSVVAIGRNALYGAVGTTTNINGTIAIGRGTLESLTTGAGNTAVGYESLKALTTGTGNTVLGYQALIGHVGGQYNTAIGWKAMDDTDSGGNAYNSNNNVAIGANALGGTWESLTTEFNVAVGNNTMSGSVSGATQNTAIGHGALAGITSGDSNVAIGYQAMDAGTTINNSIAIGKDAMGAVPAGQAVEYAVAIGVDAMKGGASTTAGINGNIAIGYGAGKSLTTGGNNTFVGYSSADELLTGEKNTCLGRHSLNNADGDEDDNTCIGYLSGTTIDDGNNNTLLGSTTDVSTAAATGQIAIGKGVACTGDNIVTIGIDANTASLGLDGSDTSWAAASSDERLKENIESSSAGLDVINDLRPVTYNWKKAKDVQKNLPQYKDSDEPVLGTEYGERLHGFIAQEVKEVIDNHDELEDGFKMWKLKDDGTQTVADGNLVPILVKAVQELSAEVKQLKQQLEDK